MLSRHNRHPTVNLQGEAYHVSIAGSWFQRKDIHRFSWVSNDGHTQKETDHILSSCGKMVRQCRVYRSFDVDSDHFPVLATLKLKLKRSIQPQSKHFIPDLSSLSNIEVSREYICGECFLKT